MAGKLNLIRSPGFYLVLYVDMQNDKTTLFSHFPTETKQSNKKQLRKNLMFQILSQNWYITIKIQDLPMSLAEWSCVEFLSSLCSIPVAVNFFLLWLSSRSLRFNSLKFYKSCLPKDLQPKLSRASFISPEEENWEVANTKYATQLCQTFPLGFLAVP